MNLRNTRAGMLSIAALVAAATWYAKDPDAVLRVLPALQSGSSSEIPRSYVHVRKVSWSPDGRKLLTLAHGEIGWDEPLMLHDFDDRPHRLPIDMMGELVTTTALAPDGRHVLVATNEGRLWWIGLESDERKLLIETPARFGFSAAALSHDGSLLAAASRDGSISLCDPERPAPAVFVSGLKSTISELRFSHDGRWLVSAGQDGWLCVWDLHSGQILRRWRGHDQPAMAAAFLSDSRVISAGLDDTIRIWEISTGREIWRGEFGLTGVTAMAVSADGKTAAWGGFQRRIVVWDLENSRKKCEICVSESVVWDVRFSPDDKSLAVAGSDGTLYDAQRGTEVAEFAIGQRL